MRKLACVLMIFCSSQLYADIDYSFHGFIAQGVARSADSDFIDEHGKWSLSLTEVGVNTRIVFTDNLQVVAQGVYLDGGNRYPKGARLDYAFIDYRFIDKPGFTTNLHLGRYKNRHWLYSATQDIPQTRPSAILPQSIYFDGFRDVSLSSDGINVIAQNSNEGGSTTFNWSLGKTEFSEELTRSLLGDVAQGDAQQRYVHQASVYWESATMNWKVGFSLLDTEFEYSANIFDQLTDGDSSFQRGQLSLRYSAQRFEINAELMQESVEINGIEIFESNRTGQGGYVQLQYFVSPLFSALLRYDTYFLDKDDRNGAQLSSQSSGLIPDYFAYMHTSTVGIRWDVGNKWRIQAEHHWVEGAGRLTPLLAPGLLPKTDRRWSTVALQVMTWF